MEYYANYSNFEYIGGGYTTLTAPYSGTSVPGQNASCSNPKTFNNSFISSADHSSGFGKMLVVDGSTSGNGQYFWRGGYNGQGFCGLTIGSVYTFSYWVKSISGLVTDTATQADIRIDFSNATDITLISGNSLAPLPISGWQKVTYSFKATGYCVNINLWDFNTNTVGNDFALDDFSLFPIPIPLAVTYSLSNGDCDTSLFPYTSGGNINIKSYSLVGPSYTKNTYPFNNLLPGNYVLSVVDADGTSASTNVVIPQQTANQLPATPDHGICSGDTTNLTVSGSSAEYYWTSTPNDVSMNSHTGSSLSVSPLVTTTYSVKSYGTNASGNLIYNGDFSMGNTGFDSQHVFYPTNFENASGAYGVVSDASLWGTGFPSCGDHTTGTGNMLVVNGTDHLSAGGGTSFWEQAVTVIGTTNYTFSFWVKSLSGNFPASLHVIINGSVYNVYPYMAPSTNNCSHWVQYSVNYFSGWMSNVADIHITDANISFIGNDFAIDDISFSTTNSCLSKTITVTVDKTESVNITHNSTTPDAITFNWNALPQATGYSISYSVNNATLIDGGTTTSNVFSVNSLNAGDTVNIVVTPIGIDCFAASNYTGNSFSPCPTPVANVTRQPTCSIPLGIITVSAPIGTQYQYSVDGTTFQSSPVFSDLAFGNYTVTVKKTSTGCQATSGILSLNQPGLVLPNISATYTYQNCSINLTANSTSPNTSIVWNGPNMTNAPNPSIASSNGLYKATVTDLLTGCTNDFTLNVSTPIAPNEPLVTITQPDCISSTGSIVITSPLGSNYEYSKDGNNYQSGINFQNLTPTTYQITAKDITTGCVSLIKQLQLIPATIDPPIPATSNITLCQNSIPSALSAIAVPNASLNWYGTNASGGIASTTATIPNTSNLGSTTYYCSQSLGSCESTRTAITVTVSGTATIPNFTDLKYCFGDNNIPPLNTISPNGIKGTWQPALISNTASGNYIFTPNANECGAMQSIAITINLPTAITFDWIVAEEFTENQVLTISTSTQGNYLYQLDSGIPQISPIFENISHGLHSITVIDSNGCSNPVTRNDILVINYPKFFTPNNDGYNDFWSIPELFHNSDTFIQIYDRYGKLLKNLNLKKLEVWDGNYNGKIMPSSDYWFVVNYHILNVPKTFKAHFSLKR